MGYTKQTWYNGASGGTPVTADALNHMETGIKGSVKGLKAGSSTVAANTSTDLVAVEGTAPVSVSGSGDTLRVALAQKGIGRTLLSQDVQDALAKGESAAEATVPDGSLTASKLVEHALLNLVTEPGTAYMSFAESNPAKLFGGTWTVRTDTYLFMGLRIYRRTA